MAVSKGGVKMPRISTGRKSVLMTADPYHTPGFVVCLSSSSIIIWNFIVFINNYHNKAPYKFI